MAAGKGEEDPKQQADIPEAMMVFCDLGPGRLDQLLNTMRRTEFPPVLLKAVLTPTNRTWDSLPALAGAAPGSMRRCGAVRKPSKNSLTNPCKNCIIIKRF